MKTEINTADYTAFIVTGLDRDGKRFRLTYAPSAAQVAFCINLFRGSVWGVLKSTGKREKLKSVYN